MGLFEVDLGEMGFGVAFEWIFLAWAWVLILVELGVSYGFWLNACLDC